jgi:hypothetical protein
MPRDPFVWPSRSESGSSLAERRVDVREPPAADAPGGEPVLGAGGATARAPAADVLGPPGTGMAEPEDDAFEPDPGQPLLPEQLPELPEAPLRLSKVTLSAGARSAERGKALLVSGRVLSGGRSCAGMSVQVDLSPPGGAGVPLGTLISDAAGNFSGRLIVPWSAPLGEHALSARAAGECEPPAR